MTQTTTTLETRTCDLCHYRETTLIGHSSIQDFDLHVSYQSPWEDRLGGVGLSGEWRHWGRQCRVCRARLRNAARECRC